MGSVKIETMMCIDVMNYRCGQHFDLLQMWSARAARKNFDVFVLNTDSAYEEMIAMCTDIIVLQMWSARAARKNFDVFLCTDPAHEEKIKVNIINIMIRRKIFKAKNAKRH